MLDDGLCLATILLLPRIANGAPVVAGSSKRRLGRRVHNEAFGLDPISESLRLRRRPPGRGAGDIVVLIALLIPLVIAHRS